MSVQELPQIEVIQVPETPEPSKADQAEADATDIQAMSEGVKKTGKTFEFMGKEFRLAEKVGLMPLMRFAHMASTGMDTDDDFMVAMATIYEMIQDVIHEDQWAAFQQHAIKTKAGEEDLLGVVHQAIEIMTARPTKSDSDSSHSAPQSTQPSTDTLSQRRAELGLTPVADLAG
jgi:hypothetical protein